MDDPAKYQAFLGKHVQVIIDRPIHSKHPTHSITYEVNYGYVPNTKAGDGNEIDAYVLGVLDPIEEYFGECIAIIYRSDDDENKLVVSPYQLDEKSIREQTLFVERYFDISIKLGPR